MTNTKLLASIALAAGTLIGCSDDGNAGPGDGSGDAVGDGTETTPDSDATGPDTTLDTEPPDTVWSDLNDTTEPADTTPVDTTPPVPDSNVTPDNSLCSSPGGSLNVYDLQNTDCPDHPSPEPIISAEAIPVELTGLIITGTFGDTFTAQDPRGGPYSGITIYNHGLLSGTVQVGDMVDFSGGYSEFFENTQIYLEDMEILGRAPSMPAPFVAEHPAHVATNGQLAEMFEGVLVQVRDVKTTHTQPDCPSDYGEFEVTGFLRIDDMGFDWNDPTGARLGDHFESITGPLMFSFGNHKIEPRNDADVVVITKGTQNAISKCLATECRARADAMVSRQVIVNEIMADPFGDDTYQEWIELYNPGDTAVNLAGWVIRDCGEQQVVPLSGPEAVIPPRGYLVVGQTRDRDDNGDVGVAIEYGVNGFFLPNTVGAVLLYNGEGPGATLVDQTRYSRFDSVGRVLLGQEPRAPGPDQRRHLAQLVGTGLVQVRRLRQLWHAGATQRLISADRLRGHAGAVVAALARLCGVLKYASALARALLGRALASAFDRNQRGRGFVWPRKDSRNQILLRGLLDGEAADAAGDFAERRA